MMTGWRIIPVDHSNAAAFVDYCRAHGAEHDESFLPQADFVPTAEYPACLMLAGESGDTIAGAASLLRTPGYVNMGIARFMILHALEPSRAAYAALLDALRPHLADLDYAFGFIPEDRTAVRAIWEGLGLRVERYAYVLEHPGTPVPDVRLPEGYGLQYVHESDQEALATFCDLLNISFAGHPQRTDATPERLVRDIVGPYGLPDGLLLLWVDGQPVGTVSVERDDEPGAAAIGGVTVHPAYRGRGLGRLLIRQALNVAAAAGLRPVYLSVSANNEAAIRLYVGEGFVKKTVVVAYRWQPDDVTQVSPEC